MKTLIFCLIILINSNSYSQTNTRDFKDPESLDLRFWDLKARKLADQSIKFPFRSIKIIDSRYDTSKIGFDTNLSLLNGKTRGFKKVIAKNGLQKTLENYYNEYYKNSLTNSSLSLLIVIKKLWLVNDTKLSSGTNSYSKQLFNLPTLKFEYYLFDDNANYLPLKRIDTTFKDDAIYRSKNSQSFDFEILSYALSIMIELIDYNKYIPLNITRKKTFQEILSYNQSSFNKSILKDSNYKAGVYMTYTEFLNNAPSKKIEELSKIENYWGYSDGKDIYIYYHQKKLYRSGNSFQYFADKIQSFGNDIFSENNRSPRIKGLQVPVQLDMETGKAY